MKKCFAFFALSCIALLFVIAGCGQNNAPASEPPMSGGYSGDRDLTEEDMAVFEEAMSGMTGVSYEPIKVATQIVAGTNYRFTCNAVVIYPGAEPYTAYVYIYKSLDGAVELTEIISDAPQPGFAANRPDDAEIEAAYHSAMEVMYWITFDAMPYGEGTQDIDGMTYQIIGHPTIKTMADLKSYLESLFAASIADDKLEGGLFRDIDGSLYKMGAARGGNIFKGDEEYEIIRESEARIIFRVTVEDLDDPGGDVIGHTIHDMIYEQIDGRWVFGSFEMVR
ncbi:MAG: hypothetical protein FWH02_08720 [Oscillospiraceae bacterium]|nr:hypothetical protein [Oscillospiraceae bacterium]